MVTDKPHEIFEKGDSLSCSKGCRSKTFRVRVFDPEQETVELICATCKRVFKGRLGHEHQY